MRRCEECGKSRRWLGLDPRVPPLETFPCICRPCLAVIHSELAEVYADLAEDHEAEGAAMGRVPGDTRPQGADHA